MVLLSLIANDTPNLFDKTYPKWVYIRFCQTDILFSFFALAEVNSNLIHNYEGSIT